MIIFSIQLKHHTHTFNGTLMKHILLIASLFLSTAHTSHAMEEIIPDLIITDPETVNIRDENDNTYLHFLCATKNMKETLQLFLSQDNVNPNICNNKNETPLHVAASCGFTHYIQLLLSHKADTRAQNNYGQTPFFDACYSGKIKNVRLLLPINTQEINNKDYNGDTPLHIACANGHTAIAKFLLKNGACPIIKNDLQRTPLAEAAFEINDFNTFYSPSLKKLLLKKDKHGNTQLHLAALLTNENTPKLTHECKLDDYLLFLVANGLSAWSRNKKNKRPVDCACKEYTALLKKYMAKKKEYLYYALLDQEEIMHAFLRVTSPRTECTLFTTILEHYLPKDVHKGIAYYYYALNIETIIAKKYKYSHDYYYDFIENKNEIKRQLCNNPESPELLW
jgi:ankyrin repeat protein